MRFQLNMFAIFAIAASQCTFVSLAWAEEGLILRDLKDLPKYRTLPQTETIKVDVQATVTYCDPGRFKLFVQDREIPVYIRGKDVTPRVAIDLPVQSRVRIRGSLPRNRGHIVAEDIQILETHRAVEPLAVDLTTLRKGNYWSHFSQLEGELRHVSRTDAHTQLVLHAGANKLICYVHGHDEEEKYCAMIGAQLRVSGVLDWEIYESGAPNQAVCQIMSFGDVAVISLSKVDSDARTVVSELRQLASIEAGTAVSASGVVTHVASAESFVLEDSTGGTLVQCGDTDAFEVGIQFLIHGVVSHSETGPMLELNHAEKLSKSEAMPLLTTTPRNVVGDGLNLRRVALAGTIQGVECQDGNCQVILSDSGFQFRAEVFVASHRELERLDLQIGERIGCRGVVFQEPATETVWFSIKVNSLDSLWVDRQSVSFDRQTAYLWLLGLTGLGAVSGIWLLAMRLQVARKRKHLAGLTARINTSYKAIKEGMIVLDSDARVASVNAQFGQITSMNLSVGDDVSDLPERLARKFQALETPEFFEGLRGSLPEPMTAQLKEIGTGTTQLNAYLAAILDESGAEIGRLLSLQDVTQQKELEDQLIQSQKMEAIGSLAGGIAHDFNNLLMVMGVNVERARSVLDESQSGFSIADASLADAEIAVQRATELVKNLLSFSRRSDPILDVHSLNDSVISTANLLRRTFPSSIQLTVDLTAELSVCRIDLNQIEQVVMNICLNARDAIEDGEGLIAISTANVVGDNGQMIRLCIEDNGKGMSDEEVRRIFEPFFTTKPTGEGTGLGMSTSYGIVVQHGGWIDCVSELGKGTKINVFLPVIATGAAKVSVDLPVAPLHSKYRGRAMVVDDEPAVRQITAKLMNRLGFTVTEVKDGQTALRLARTDSFDLVLLDLNMPGMTGHDVFGLLNSELPDLPVIICTGYLHDVASLVCADGTPPAAVLRKPFRLPELEDVCYQTLGDQS